MISFPQVPQKADMVCIGNCLKNKLIKKYKNLSPNFIFLYPAYNMRNNEIGGLLGFVSMMIFLFILAVGFIYECKKGALDWE